jgi:hypothetical protein
VFKGCYCQIMNDDAWQQKEFFWEEPRFFYRVTARMALHSPITYNEDISRAMMEAKTRGYIIKPKPLILLKSGLFRGEIFLEINKPSGPEVCQEDENGPCHSLQGAFYTVVTKSPPFHMGAAIEKLNRDLKKKGHKVRDIYLCLAICPSCSKEKGNHTVIFAHLDPQTA